MVAVAQRIAVVFTDHSLSGLAGSVAIHVNKCLQFTLAGAHAVICVSHTSKANTCLRACVPPHKVFVIPNAVDASAFPPLTGEYTHAHTSFIHIYICIYREREAVFSEWTLESDSGRLLYVELYWTESEIKKQNESGFVTCIVMNRMTYRKGVDLLAAVVPEACRRYPNIRFVIGGDGPLKWKVVRMARVSASSWWAFPLSIYI